MLGPALTFRIRQNEHNMTAAEVAAKAGEARHCAHANLQHRPTHRLGVKYVRLCALFMCVVTFFIPTVSEQNFLESETGLKIIQTGVGEVHAHKRSSRSSTQRKTVLIAAVLAQNRWTCTSSDNDKCCRSPGASLVSDKKALPH